jgi:DNA-binding CsgD family transcriptional regulator
LRLSGQHQHALDRGDEASIPFLLYHLSELECWAGNWNLAEEYALEGLRVAEESRQQAITPAALYSLALVRAYRGQVAQARALAAEAIVRCEQTGNVPLATQVLSVLGFIAVSLDEYATAHSHLGRLVETTAALGLAEPGVVRFLPDEIEALAALGELDLARTLTRQLEEEGEVHHHRWALATAARCRAQLAAHNGDLEGAQAACAQALSRHEQLPVPFELGRTLLVKGRIERRRRHKLAARRSFGEALGIFERLGAPLWTGKTYRELSKIAMRARVGGLTETERRIAELVVRGHTNREIALRMFVTENTVQTHVRHVFQKLGVRSRTELAARLLSNQASTDVEPLLRNADGGEYH